MAGQQNTDALFSHVDVDIALILLTGAALIGLARRTRQPPVIGEILAGIALGPSLLGLLPGHLDQRLFPADVRSFLSAIGQVGLLLFMFIIGCELDPGRLGRLKRSASMVSTGATAFPFALGFATAGLYYRGPADGGYWTFAIYFGFCMSITAFPVLARILSDANLVTTRIGELTMASAAMTDVMIWCLLSVITALRTAGDPSHLAAELSWTVAYSLGLWLVIRPLLRWLLARVGACPAYVLAVCAAGLLLSSWATEAIGIHPIFGAFAFGIALPRESRALVETHVVPASRGASALLLPVYFIGIGLSVDVSGLRVGDLLLLVLAVAAAFAGKVLGAAVPARLTGWPPREAAVIGVLMNTRGLTEIIVLNLGLSLGLLDTRQFTILVLMALITTCATGPLINRLLPGAFAQPATVRQVTEGEERPVPTGAHVS